MARTTFSRSRAKGTSRSASTTASSSRSTHARRAGSLKKVDRTPFDPAILRRAAEIADRYQIVLQYEDGTYYGRGLELPNVMNDGPTPDACVRATREMLTSTVAYMLEAGQVPPAPAGEGVRSEQINIRVSAEEKLLLERAAKDKGFRGISDFVRDASLSNAR